MKLSRHLVHSDRLGNIHFEVNRQNGLGASVDRKWRNGGTDKEMFCRQSIFLYQDPKKHGFLFHIVLEEVICYILVYVHDLPTYSLPGPGNKSCSVENSPVHDTTLSLVTK